MNDTTVLPVKDHAMEDARNLCMFNRNALGEKFNITRDGIKTLDFLPDRKIQ